MIPLIIGSPHDFTIVRDFLKTSGYNEPAACERLGIARIAELVTSERRPLAGSLDALQVLLRLFLGGSRVRAEQVKQVVPGEVLRALFALGLLVDDGAAEWAAPCLLYPVYGIYIASDRLIAADGSAQESPQNFVYPALTPHTGDFLDVLPETPCELLLDLCGGTGVAALGAASRYARQTWSTDLTERCTAYAEWNRRLNGLDNVIIARGDLFEPVKDIVFDRIVTHPPYDPTSQSKLTYAQAGEHGEELIRKIFEQLPHFLAPGGRLYCVAMLGDRSGKPIEQRIREWLGVSADDFDIAVAAKYTMSADELAVETMIDTRGTHEQLADCKLRLSRLGIEMLTYGCFVVQRKASERPVFTVRRLRGPEWRSADIEWLLGWETEWSRDPDQLWALPVTVSQHLEVDVRHRLVNGTLKPSTYIFRLRHPFDVSMEGGAGLLEVIGRCDGAKTVRDIYDELIAADKFPAEADRNVFVRLLGGMVSTGILVARGFERPESVAKAADAIA